ncbi:HAMP domain-containing histidine kinase [Viridibacillus sp. YIM B01967]|uniref:histidine kinase n=1 Tax=Viridibacillus soli TaxID=2798301 RepID=A0ABS1H902_9BACL|nr:HAMP domain-containing sensor histidine kinase [Viridibacillus soli]MBK3495900.1 HAMP domain-containing histidine kinase [Viridibacillus soli]
MRWRLTGRFLWSVVVIVIIVGIVNTMLLAGLLLTRNSYLTFNTSDTSAEAFTRSFSQYIEMENGLPFVNVDGVKALQDKHAWIQFLDNNGQQVAALKTPKNLATSYSPAEIIQMYKYQEIDGTTTVYIGAIDDLSYFIGIKDNGVRRYVLTYDYTKFFKFFNLLLITFLIVDVLIALIIGLLFTRHLTKPLHTLIEGIGQLRNRQFTKINIPKGVYTDVFRNVNELSEKLNEHEKERDHLDQMREEWISNVSHDMKTPLASIQGYAELMKDGARDLTTDEVQEYSTIVEKKSIYMKDLLDDLNLTTRLRNQQLPMHFEVINIVSFMRELTIDLLNDPQFGERQVEFVSNVDNLVHKVDKKLLKRAVLNFIYNALVHNDENVCVTIRIDAVYPQGGQSLLYKTRITISDNGRGISAKDLEQVFDRYYRGTNTKNTHGTGLGMAIARDIIFAHHGDLELSSIENKGTKIVILL